jgi:hypothetical protein
MALKFFLSLNQTQKSDFFAIIKQVEIDTIASFLAILDGASSLDNKNIDFFLTADHNKNNIAGDLSDLFLEIAEIERGD